MKLQVIFAPPFNEAAGRRSATVELPDGATVADLLCTVVEDYTAIRQALVDARGRLLLGSEFFATVDDKVAKAEQPIREGSVVHLFPAIGGGSELGPGCFAT